MRFTDPAARCQPMHTIHPGAPTRVCAGLVDGAADALQLQASRVGHRFGVGQVHLEALHKPAARVGEQGQATNGVAPHSSCKQEHMRHMSAQLAATPPAGGSCNAAHSNHPRQHLLSRVRSLRCSQMMRAMAWSLASSSSTCNAVEHEPAS